MGRPRCSVMGSARSALQFWGETQRQEAARRVASSTAAAPSKSWGAVRTTASSSPTRPAAPPSRPHSRPSLEPGVVRWPHFTPVLQENKTATGNQTPGCQCADPALEPVRMRIGGGGRDPGSRGGVCGSRPPRRQSLRMPGLPVPVPPVTVGNTSVELAF